MPIACPTRVAGVGAITPLGVGALALVEGLRAGRCAIAPPRRLRISGVLPRPLAEVDLVTPAEGDRALYLAARAGEEALLDAGWGTSELDDARTLLVVASTKAGIDVGAGILEGRVAPRHAASALLFTLGPRLAETLNLKGPVRTVSLACASGLVAIGFARRALDRGEFDRALVVGTDSASGFVYRGFSSLQALDPEGARPFDAHRAGLTVGEGAAAVALERGPGELEIAGYGASNDANHITGPARDGRGLARALEVALSEAGEAASAIAFGVLHGTGTRYNDAMEGVAYARVFGPRAFPALSVKGSIGHLMGAAGLVNLVVAIESLRSGLCPPNVGLRVRDPEIPLDIVSFEPRAIRGATAITSASGFGGVNAAVVLRLAEGSTSASAGTRTPSRRPLEPGPASPSEPRWAPSPSSRPGLEPADLAAEQNVEAAAPRSWRRADPPELREARGRSAGGGPALVTAFVDLPPDRPRLVRTLGLRSSRRFDDFCVFTVAAVDAALEAAGLSVASLASVPHALVLGTALGCLESDHAFYLREIEPERHDPSPRIFAYTLPNIGLGEAAIRHRLIGEHLVVSAGRASGLAALAEAADLVARGNCEVVLALVIDAVGAGAGRLLHGTPGVRPRSAAFVVERSHQAEARGARPLARIAGRALPKALEPDLRRPAALEASSPPVSPGTAVGSSSEDLGATGVSAVIRLLLDGRPGNVTVRCPTGYAATLEVEPSGVISPRGR